MRIEEVGTGEDMKLLFIGDDGTKTKFVLKPNETWSNRKGTQSLSRSNFSHGKYLSYRSWLCTRVEDLSIIGKPT